MNLILSVDRNWSIGRDDQLLFRAKEDMAFFRKMTTGKTVVMGRRTLQSLPEGKPLPDRNNIVLTRDPEFTVKGATVCRSMAGLFQRLRKVNEDDIFIIGGEEIYRQLMFYCKTAYITKFDAVAMADSTVPSFDNHPDWQLTEQSAVQTEGSLAFTFCTYTQAHPKAWK